MTGHDASKVRVIPSLPWIDVGMLDLAGFDLESPWVSVHDLPLAVLELSTRPRTGLARASRRPIGARGALSVLGFHLKKEARKAEDLAQRLGNVETDLAKNEARDLERWIVANKLMEDRRVDIQKLFEKLEGKKSK